MNDRKAPIDVQVTIPSCGTVLVPGTLLPEHATKLWIHRMRITKVSGPGTTSTLLDLENYNGVTATLLYSFRPQTMNALLFPYDTAQADRDNNALPVYVKTQDPSYLRVSVKTDNASQSDTVTIILTVSAA